MIQQWPATPNRMYIPREIECFATSHYNWSYDYSIDKEINLGHSIDLYKIWAGKIFMVGDAIQLNPYKTTSFAWVDIGCYRHEYPESLYIGYPRLQDKALRVVLFVGVASLFPKKI